MMVGGLRSLWRRSVTAEARQVESAVPSPAREPELSSVEAREQAVAAIQRRMLQNSLRGLLAAVVLAGLLWLLLWVVVGGSPARASGWLTLWDVRSEAADAVTGETVLSLGGAWLGIGLTLVLAVSLTGQSEGSRGSGAPAASLAVLRWLERVAAVVLLVAASICLAAVLLVELSTAPGVITAGVLVLFSLVAVGLMGAMVESREQLRLRLAELEQQRERAEVALRDLEQRGLLASYVAVLWPGALAPMLALLMGILINGVPSDGGWWAVGSVALATGLLAWGTGWVEASGVVSRTIRQRPAMPRWALIVVGIFLTLYTWVVSIAVVVTIWESRSIGWGTLLLGLLLALSPWCLWWLNRWNGSYSFVTRREIASEARRLDRRLAAERRHFEQTSLSPDAPVRTEAA